MKTAIELARPAPATPSACPVPQPVISTGASAMLMMTASTCTSMLGRTMPVARSAAAITCVTNCSASAGMNQNR